MSEIDVESRVLAVAPLAFEPSSSLFMLLLLLPLLLVLLFRLRICVCGLPRDPREYREPGEGVVVVRDVVRDVLGCSSAGSSQSAHVASQEATLLLLLLLSMSTARASVTSISLTQRVESILNTMNMLVWWDSIEDGVGICVCLFSRSSCGCLSNDWVAESIQARASQWKGSPISITLNFEFQPPHA